MTTELGRRLREVAADAPPTLPADGLWDRGLRRHRTRRLAGVVGSIVVLATLVGGIGIQALDGPDRRAQVAAAKPGDLHLPRTIAVPAPWSKGTADEGELGVLAAVGASDRKRPKGIAGMVAYQGLYGVSAVDGTVRFLDLPTPESKDMPGQFINAALSPDGRKLAYPRYDGNGNDTSSDGSLVGWSVYDTVTGKITELQDPEAPRIEAGASDLAFSTDSRFLLTSYAAAGNADSESDEFVAWNVADGSRTVVEGAGEYWLPNIGSGPGGIVWSRDNDTYTYGTVAGATTSIRTEHDPVTASFAPSGSGFAYVGGTLAGGRNGGIDAPWKLYVGPTPDRMRQVPGITDAGLVLGWRDPDHVVVATTDRDYVVVDVNDRSIEKGRIGGNVNLAVPMLASDLWANDLVDGVQPPDASDPRTPARIAVLGAGLVLAVGVFGTIRWRRRRG
ncbi:hypothetical protein EFK50_02420 [Nocardioides marmoriginsengisoli]|uniref:WD40 repeat domain-containing protein n=1 Tax=Nocardioides marmoriginsengisoli TaxID=661483 RepID=A0A3N0CN27_9ACTN|nr:hypothetical protein [Nocardioides marmoriginsengisoli]RNL64862.1 hypothetical protein EFK50_02420 [Nocardioides marmoriginsengisoli]